MDTPEAFRNRVQDTHLLRIMIDKEQRLDQDDLNIISADNISVSDVKYLFLPWIFRELYPIFWR